MADPTEELMAKLLNNPKCSATQEQLLMCTVDELREYVRRLDESHVNQTGSTRAQAQYQAAQDQTMRSPFDNNVQAFDNDAQVPHGHPNSSNEASASFSLDEKHMDDEEKYKNMHRQRITNALNQHENLDHHSHIQAANVSSTMWNPWAPKVDDEEHDWQRSSPPQPKNITLSKKPKNAVVLDNDANDVNENNAKPSGMVNMKHVAKGKTPFDTKYHRFMHICNGKHVKQEAFVSISQNLKGLDPRLSACLDDADHALLKQTMGTLKNFGQQSHKTLLQLYNQMKVIYQAKREAYTEILRNVDKKQGNKLFGQFQNRLKALKSKLDECGEVLSKLGAKKVAPM